VALAIGVVVIGAGSAVAIAATGDDRSGLQLAKARTGSVTETVASSGTVSSSSKSTAAFSVSGTVASIAVHVGDSVRKGQRLAQLDTQNLRSQVESVQASLASAKQKLESDKTGQTSQTSSANGGSGGLTTSSLTTSSLTTSSLTGLSGAAPTSSLSADSHSVQPLPVHTASAADASVRSVASPSAGSPSVTQLIAQVKQSQAAVIAGQHAVDAAQTEIDAAQKVIAADVVNNTSLRDAQRTACASPPSGSTQTDECVTAMANYQAFADTLASDSAALGTKITAQDQKITDLEKAMQTLDGLIGQLEKAAQTAGSVPGGGTGTGGSGRPTPATPTTPTRPSTGSTGTRPSGSNSGGDSTGNNSPSTPTPQPASAAQLAADQAQIDSWAAQLAVAEQNLAAATLHSPISGTVAQIDLTAGGTAGSNAITVVGTGIQGVQTSVSLAQLATVKVGQPVTVRADGVASTLHGTVESVGLLSTTSGSRTTFPLVVRLKAGSPRLFDGAGAEVVITTGTATSVLTVPTSAVHTGIGSTHTVTVVHGTKTSSVRVTLGLTGTDLTQITAGLKAGDQVMLADLSKSLPTSTTSTNRFGGFTGQFPNFGTRGGGR
jgi:multidrug efflux pump subunit AcrA (membrane-fusion protein)